MTKPVEMPVISARIEAQLSRSRSEREVRDSQQRHALAARGGSDGFWDVNLVTGEVHAEWAGLLGYSAEELGTTFDSWFALVHSEDVNRVRDDFEAAIQNRVPEFHSEFRMRTKGRASKGGINRWVLARGSVLWSAEGKPLRIAGSLTDLTQLKFSDPLTGLGNRAMLLDRLGEILALKSKHPFALILLDLDGFKRINDTYGTGTGDRIIKEMGQRMRKAVADSEFVDAAIPRIGEDEFTVLLTETSSEGQVNDFSDTLLAILSSPIPLDGLEINSTASAGIVIDEAGRSHGEHILRDAGLAMFQAKELGRNRSQLFVPGMRERAETRMDLLRDLHHVIENNQLEAFYQPKVNLQALKIVGFEALLRWRHPVRGLINPYQFVPLAEESGLILPVGDWILSEATRQLVAWQRTYPLAAALSMNVNLSVKQLVDPGLLVREEYSFGTSRTWDWPENRRLWNWLFIVELSARATF